MLVAADAPADLVQLGEAEHVCAVDDNGVRVGDVDARADDRGADEHVDLVSDKRRHDLL